MHGEVSDGGVAHATVEAPHEANVEAPDEVLDETKPLNCG